MLESVSIECALQVIKHGMKKNGTNIFNEINRFPWQLRTCTRLTRTKSFVPKSLTSKTGSPSSPTRSLTLGGLSVWDRLSRTLFEGSNVARRRVIGSRAAWATRLAKSYWVSLGSAVMWVAASLRPFPRGLSVNVTGGVCFFGGMLCSQRFKELNRKPGQGVNVSLMSSRTLRDANQEIRGRSSGKEKVPSNCITWASTLKSVNLYAKVLWRTTSIKSNLEFFFSTLVTATFRTLRHVELGRRRFRTLNRARDKCFKRQMGRRRWGRRWYSRNCSPWALANGEQDEWDAESEDEKPKTIAAPPPPKPKKSVKQAIAEREERERKAAAEKAERKVCLTMWND